MEYGEGGEGKGWRGDEGGLGFKIKECWDV